MEPCAKEGRNSASPTIKNSPINNNPKQVSPSTKFTGGIIPISESIRWNPARYSVNPDRIA